MIKMIRNFLNGLAFGITETVPGFSGGTTAIILGFYDELIKSVNSFRKEYKKSLKFLAPLLLGIAVGVLTFSSIANYLLTNYSFPTMAFFIGLIAGIIPIIYSKVKEPGRRFKIREIILIIVPVLILIIITHLRSITNTGAVTNPAEVIENIDVPFMIFIFISGIIGAAALIIPGISGSFVLLLMGIYPLATYSLSSISVFLTDITNTALFFNICKVLVPLAIGVIIGGLSMARLIEKLLKDHKKTIYSIILGLLSGSVFALFSEPMVYKSGISTITIAIGTATFFLGCILSFVMGKKHL